MVSFGCYAPCNGKTSRPIEHTIEFINTSTFYLLSYFSNLYYFFSFFVVDNVHCFNDGEALERSGWLGQPIAAARPDGVPLGRMGFRVSQETSPTCLAYRTPGKAPPATCLVYRAHRWRYKVQVWTSPRHRPI